MSPLGGQFEGGCAAVTGDDLLPMATVGTRQRPNGKAGSVGRPRSRKTCLMTLIAVWLSHAGSCANGSDEEMISGTVVVRFGTTHSSASFPILSFFICPVGIRAQLCYLL